MWIIIALISSIVLLFISMVLSSMAAMDITKQNYTSAHNYSTLSALVCAFSIIILSIIVSVILFWKHKKL